MTESTLPKRREFLGSIAAGAFALGLNGALPRTLSAKPTASPDTTPSDKWLGALTGKHRQLFDMPNHQNGMALLHVRNYLNTLRDTYHVTKPDVTAVVTLYGMSTLTGFGDAVWQKYGLGNPLKVMDGSNVAATSNVFFKAPAGSQSLSISGAPIPIPADASISSLQDRGALFIMCNNAFNLWMGLLAGGDAAKTTQMKDEFLANLLPGVHLVPAMVVAINQAQTHGCTYMYL